jgi:hypothetical protein
MSGDNLVHARSAKEIYRVYAKCMRIEQRRLAEMVEFPEHQATARRRFFVVPWEHFEAKMAEISREPARLESQLEAIRRLAHWCGVAYQF